jgi:hypothetical protein
MPQVERKFDELHFLFSSPVDYSYSESWVSEPGCRRAQNSNCLAQYPHGRSKVQVAVLTGYAASGGGSTTISVPYARED